jgi:chromosome segregation ATPase
MATEFETALRDATNFLAAYQGIKVLATVLAAAPTAQALIDSAGHRVAVAEATLATLSETLAVRRQQADEAGAILNDISTRRDAALRQVNQAVEAQLANRQRELDEIDARVRAAAVTEAETTEAAVAHRLAEAEAFTREDAARRLTLQSLDAQIEDRRARLAELREAARVLAGGG